MNKINHGNLTIKTTKNYSIQLYPNINVFIFNNYKNLFIHDLIKIQ